MTAATWWRMMRRVLVVSGVLVIGASYVFNLQLDRLFLTTTWDIPKPMTRVFSVTSPGKWRTTNRSINFDWVTNWNYTTVNVIDRKPMYHVGDTVHLAVVARDGNNRQKVYGGDYLRAVLRDHAQKASTAGKIKDHGDGSYTVSFLLSFAGTLTPEVQLVHPSEAVQLLKEFREVPNKREWVCTFKSDKGYVTKVCTMLPNRLLPLSSQCDYSVPDTSRTWFCEDPRTAACDSIWSCKSTHDIVDNITTPEERQLFESPFRMATLATNTKETIVVQKAGGKKVANVTRALPSCKPGLQRAVNEGFWLNDTWHSLTCRVKEFKPQDITKCLSNKVLHFRGDSTCRQWLQHLVELNVVQYKVKGNIIFGPFTTENHTKAILATFDFHTVPIQTVSTRLFQNLNESGLALEIKSMIGGPNVVLLLSVCAHFVAEPKHVYSSRMYEIKSAIQELHKKYPETKVLVKTCNTRGHRDYREVVQMSDWLADQLNQEMRSILEDLNVAILDVWDMTVSQWHRIDIHPTAHVVDNELNILMSYVCPETIDG